MIKTGIIGRRFRKLSSNEFGEQETVADDIESDKSEKRLGKKLRTIPANSWQMKYLKKKKK